MYLNNPIDSVYLLKQRSDTTIMEPFSSQFEKKSGNGGLDVGRGCQNRDRGRGKIFFGLLCFSSLGLYYYVGSSMTIWMYTVCNQLFITEHQVLLVMVFRFMKCARILCLYTLSDSEPNKSIENKILMYLSLTFIIGLIFMPEIPIKQTQT